MLVIMNNDECTQSIHIRLLSSTSAHMTDASDCSVVKTSWGTKSIMFASVHNVSHLVLADSVMIL